MVHVWYDRISHDGISLYFQSTESDLSWESDEVSTNSKVSLDEFDAQYKELTEWLHQIQHVTMKQGSSLSEKYLNQVGRSSVTDCLWHS